MRAPILLTATFALACTLGSSAYAWTIDYTVGDVSVETVSGTHQPATPGEQLAPGDQIVTGAGAKALLTDGKSEIVVSGNSKFKIEQPPQPEKKKLGLLNVIEGKIRARLKRLDGEAEYPYEIRAGAIVAGVRGTEFFVVVEKDKTSVATVEGVVRVSSFENRQESYEVPAGRTLEKAGANKPVLRPNDPTMIKQWHAETKVESRKTQPEHTLHPKRRPRKPL